MERIKRLQGTPAFIETHYEALYYYKQEKKLCHFRNRYNECTNEKCLQCKSECIGYTKCPEFISTTRYEEKALEDQKTFETFETFETFRKKINKKQKQKQKVIKNKQPKKKKTISKKRNKKILKDYERSNKSEQYLNTLGNDPKLRAVFEQFRNSNK